MEDGMSPHAIDNDRSGRAQQQGGHDDNGGQDDEDNDPDIQDVLGERGFHRDLADGVHAASLVNREARADRKRVFQIPFRPKCGRWVWEEGPRLSAPAWQCTECRILDKRLRESEASNTCVPALL